METLNERGQEILSNVTNIEKKSQIKQDMDGDENTIIENGNSLSERNDKPSKNKIF